MAFWDRLKERDIKGQQAVAEAKNLIKDIHRPPMEAEARHQAQQEGLRAQAKDLPQQIQQTVREQTGPTLPELAERTTQPAREAVAAAGATEAAKTPSAWEDYKSTISDLYGQMLEANQANLQRALEGTQADEATMARRAREMAALGGSAYGGTAGAGAAQAALAGERMRGDIRGHYAGQEQAIRMGQIGTMAQLGEAGAQRQHQRDLMAAQMRAGMPGAVPEDLGGGGMFSAGDKDKLIGWGAPAGTLLLTGNPYAAAAVMAATPQGRGQIKGAWDKFKGWF